METLVFVRSKPRALIIKSPASLCSLSLFIERAQGNSGQIIVTAQFVPSDSIRWEEFSPLLPMSVYGCIGLIQIENGSLMLIQAG
jgi:hypothetical protein